MSPNGVVLRQANRINGKDGVKNGKHVEFEANNLQWVKLVI